MKYKIEDTEVYYKIYGEGIPILMIHGLGPDHRIMIGCMEPIFKECKGWQRIYFDLPGMGKTGAPDWVDNSDRMLDVIMDFIKTIIPGQHFILAGESYGGYLARGVIHNAPELVDGLLLICPVIIPEPDKRNLPKHQILESDPEFISTLTKQEKVDFLPWAVIQTKHVWERVRDEVIVGFKIANEPFLEKLFLEGYPFSFEVDEFSAPFEKPTLILAGKQDAMVGYQDILTILHNYPRATYAVLDKAGHNLQIEQAVIFNVLVGNWLTRIKAEI